MKLRDMKAEHNKKLLELRSLDQKDSMSEDEQKKFDQLYSETDELKKQIEKRQRLQTLELSVAPEPEKKTEQRYSLARAIKCLLTGKGEGFEYEQHRELEKRGAVAQHRGFLVPAKEIYGEPQALEKRIINAQSSLVSDPVRGSEYVKSLYERTILQRLGCRFISAIGDFSFPKSSGVSSSWWNADGTGSITESDPTYSSVDVSAKFLGTLTGWSLKQLSQLSKNDLSIESLAREDMTMSMAEELDKAAFKADGTSNAPKGIISQLGSGRETSKDLTTEAKKWTLSDLLTQVKELQQDSKMNLKNLAWVMSPLVANELQQVQKFSSSDGKALMENGQVLGMTGGITNWLANAEPKSANGDVELIVGSWDQFVCISYGSVELSLGQMDDDFKKGITRLRAISQWDFALRREEFFRMIRVDRKA